MTEDIEIVGNVDSWNSYPKIHALGHPGLGKFFGLDEETIFEEKIDGSQFSFGVFPADGVQVGPPHAPVGFLRARSRKVQLHEKIPEGNDMFCTGWQMVREMAARLTPGWTYRAEYLRTPKHNSIAYDRVPNRHLIVFDIARGVDDYLSRDEMEAECERLGLECVPVLHRGKANSEELAKMIADGTSVLGGMVEGVVVKNRGKLFGNDGKPVYAKFVSERFKEIHSKEYRKTHPARDDVVAQLQEMLHVEARWEKTVLRLRDAGELTHSPQDIGPLLKDLHQDLEEECGEMIREALYAHFRKTIMRGAVRGFPEWYKMRLAKDVIG